MNQFKAVISAITAAAALLCGTAQAAEKVLLSGMPDTTPAENVFMVDGYPQRFLLLDTTEDEKSRYFVMLIDNCGTATFDADNTQKFDVNDKNNVAYRLNTEFANAQISANVSTGLAPSSSDAITAGLPKEMSAHIDKEHLWRIEGGNAGGLCPYAYEEKAGISLLSQEELIKYRSKIGRKDDIAARGALGWWLRTPVSKKNTQLLTVRIDNDELYGQETAEYDANKGMALRPVFYLDQEFFKKVRLAPYSIGDKVRETIKYYHTQQDLSALYSQSELWNALQFKPPLAINDAQAGEGGLEIKVSYTNYTNASSEIMLSVVWYDKNKIQKAYRIKRDTIGAAQTKSITLEPEEGEYTAAAVFAWDLSQSSIPVSNVYTIHF